jgi:DNA-binding response OmpR family regulator
MLRQIRQDSAVPVLMLTARDEEADRVIGLEVGADAALTYGPLRLDPEAYRATLDEEPLDLTRTEFELLHLLLRNPGRAFSRTYLLDMVWGQTYVTGDLSVDNAILRLRRKLGDLGEAIETVWGVGYRLRDDR